MTMTCWHRFQCLSCGQGFVWQWHAKRHVCRAQITTRRAEVASWERAVQAQGTSWWLEDALTDARARWYRLAADGRTPVPCDVRDLGKDGEGLGVHIKDGHTERDGVRVSTVFLALDHSFTDGPPVLWETMVFGQGDGDEYQERYTSYEDAVEGHKRACEFAFGNAVKRGIKIGEKL